MCSCCRTFQRAHYIIQTLQRIEHRLSFCIIIHFYFFTAAGFFCGSIFVLLLATSVLLILKKRPLKSGLFSVYIILLAVHADFDKPICFIQRQFHAFAIASRVFQNFIFYSIIYFLLAHFFLVHSKSLCDFLFCTAKMNFLGELDLRNIQAVFQTICKINVNSPDIAFF